MITQIFGTVGCCEMSCRKIVARKKVAGAMAGARKKIACFLRPKVAPDVGSDVWAGVGPKTKTLAVRVPKSVVEMQPPEKKLGAGSVALIR